MTSLGEDGAGPFASHAFVLSALSSCSWCRGVAAVCGIPWAFLVTCMCKETFQNISDRRWGVQSVTEPFKDPFRRTWREVIKICSTQLTMKFFLIIKVYDQEK